MPTDRYREAGVDIDAGARLVEAIKPAAKATVRAGAIGGLGGFGALFDLKAAGFRDPLLVATTDGVGTKLLVAQAVGMHDTIGTDLVGMCANDIVVQGATPLFFLDYYATGRLDVAAARSVIEGIARACAEIGCALIGGETAEMPGLYRERDYDLAGFCVGAVERDRVLTGTRVAAGDAILGMASNGVHSNGFSLIRRVVEAAGLDYGAAAPFAAEESLGRALLRPTRLYVRPCLALVEAGQAHAFAHITGGGLLENIPRVIPDGLVASLDAGGWPLPPVFGWLMRAAHMAPLDLARTFNCGIGMVAIVAEAEAEAAMERLSDQGETVFRIGRVEAAPGSSARARLHGTESWGG